MEEDNKIVGQLIDLALLANGLLKGEALNKFVRRSVELIKLIDLNEEVSSYLVHSSDFLGQPH